MYQVLARKYRPQTFDAVVGQEEAVRSMRNAFESGKTAHAYLFAGPRGTGKTSMARIFAKALLCEKGPTPAPCNACALCREISAGSSIDVLEIDGASNRGIDEIRALRESVNLRPGHGRAKVYIIDEVHMLTPEAFNALLKTLEEPPGFVHFVLATTAPERIPATILSRCQKCFFRPLTAGVMKEALADIAKREGIAVDDEALQLVVEFSAGAMRDGLSVLDQASVYAGGGSISAAQIEALLGLVEETAVERLLLLMREGRVDETVRLFHELLRDGKDPGLILDAVVKKLRNIGYARMGDPDALEREAGLVGRFSGISLEGLLDALSLAVDCKERLRRESLQVVLVEILFLRLTRLFSPREGDTGSTRIAEPGTSREAGRGDPPTGATIRQGSGSSAGYGGGKEAAGKAKETVKAKAPAESRKTPSRQATVRDAGAARSHQSAPVEAGVPGSESTTPGSAPGEHAELWKRILREVKKVKPTVEAALREGTLDGILEDRVTIRFPAKWAFHKSLVEKPANRPVVERVLSDVLGRPVTAVFLHGPEDGVALLERPEIRETIAFFDGEVERVEE